MPMYLKRDTIRLLEASVDSISMAVTLSQTACSVVK